MLARLDAVLIKHAERGATWWSVTTTALAPVFVTGGYLAADLLQPDDYSPVRQSISVLAGHAGSHRWVMTACTLAVGLCLLIAPFGIARLGLPARILLGIEGAAGVGVALWPEPTRGSTFWHIFCTVVGAILLAGWPLAAGWPRRTSPLPLTLRCSAAAAAVFSCLTLWCLAETQLGPMLGLAERVTATAELSWPFVVTLSLWLPRPIAESTQPIAMAAERADGLD